MVAAVTNACALQFSSTDPSLPFAGQGHRSPKLIRKAPVPDKNDVPLLGLKANTNFIATNALDVIKAVPRQPDSEFYYTQKPDYGQVPEYLVQAKLQQEEALARKAERERLQLEEVSHSTMLQGRCRY